MPLASPLLPVTHAAIVTAHGAALVAEVRVNAAARDSYLALVADTEFPVGTQFFELLREPRSGRGAGALSLRRGEGGWEFQRFDAAGRPAPQSALAFCAGCHAQALAPPVFGVPRSASEP